MQGVAKVYLFDLTVALPAIRAYQRAHRWDRPGRAGRASTNPLEAGRPENSV